jgi:hypothetical protein
LTLRRLPLYAMFHLGADRRPEMDRTHGLPPQAGRAALAIDTSGRAKGQHQSFEIALGDAWQALSSP